MNQGVEQGMEQVGKNKMNHSSNRVVSTHDLFPIIYEELKNGKKVKFTVSGTSMLPWISNNRDQVLLVAIDNKQLKLGDIILFQDKRGEYILHRIYKKDTEGYHTIGDGCIFEDGRVLPDKMIGVVEKIYRKGKEIDCNSFFWRMIFLTWRHLLPIRKYILNIYFILVKWKGFIKLRNSNGV